MRILWVKVGGLWPLNAGGRIRSYHMLRELSTRHQVSVLTTHPPDAAVPDLAAALPDCERVTSFPHAPAKRTSAVFAVSLVRSWFSSLPADLWRWRVPAVREAADAALASGRFDVCVADFLTALPNLPSESRVPVILFEHNVEYLIWQRLSRAIPSWQRPVVELEWRKLLRYERQACANADVTVAVSEPDRTLLASIAPRATVRAVPTGVDTTYFARDADRESHVGVTFVGSMDWYPNEDAAIFLIDEILPRLRERIPRVVVRIVGRDPSARLRAAAAREGVTVTGTVADVRPYIADAAVLVVPIRIGGGTRLKIFEALAMGKAVVSTTVGAEGLPLVPGRHFMAADDPVAFADAIILLLRDPSRRRELGAAGRELVDTDHSWAHVARTFEDRCHEALVSSPAGRQGDAE